MKIGFQFIKSERKLITILGELILIIIIFSAIYLPMRKKFLNLEKEWKNYEKSLVQARIVESLSLRTKLSKNNFSLAKELDGLKKLFPSVATDVINDISKLRYKSNIELLSITPSNKEWATDENKNELKVGERRLEKTTLSLILQTDFVNLANYLEKLLKLNALVIINKLDISKMNYQGLESNSLRVNLDIAVYTLLPKLTL